MADALRINGNQFSWGSIVLKIDSERYTGFTSISFADKRERVKAYGMTRHHAPRGRSRGKYTIDPVKLVGWKSSVSAVRAALAARSSDLVSYGDVEFQIVVQYVESDESPLTVLIDGCVWASNSSTDDEGPDPLKEEIEIDAMLIKRNDLVLFDASEGSP
jgi:hypothetical protein